MTGAIFVMRLRLVLIFTLTQPMFAVAAHEYTSDDLLGFLSFSGGGHRAAHYALGGLAAVEETSNAEKSNLFSEVDYVSSVSGGSYGVSTYISSYVDYRCSTGREGHVVEVLKNSRNRLSLLRDGWTDKVLLPVLGSSTPILDRGVVFYKLIELYHGKLVQLPENCLKSNVGLTIGDSYSGVTLLQNGENFQLPFKHLINATNANTGRIFTFSTDVPRHSRFYDEVNCFPYRHNRYSSIESLDDVGYAFAVGASAAFPPLVPDLQLGISNTGSCKEEAIRFLPLTDGGQADDNGIDTVKALLKSEIQRGSHDRGFVIAMDAMVDSQEPLSSNSDTASMLQVALLRNADLPRYRLKRNQRRELWSLDQGSENSWTPRAPKFRVLGSMVSFHRNESSERSLVMADKPGSDSDIGTLENAGGLKLSQAILAFAEGYYQVLSQTFGYRPPDRSYPLARAFEVFCTELKYIQRDPVYRQCKNIYDEYRELQTYIASRVVRYRIKETNKREKRMCYGWKSTSFSCATTSEDREETRRKVTSSLKSYLGLSEDNDMARAQFVLFNDAQEEQYIEEIHRFHKTQVSQFAGIRAKQVLDEVGLLQANLRSRIDSLTQKATNFDRNIQQSKFEVLQRREGSLLNLIQSNWNRSRFANLLSRIATNAATLREVISDLNPNAEDTRALAEECYFERSDGGIGVRFKGKELACDEALKRIRGSLNDFDRIADIDYSDPYGYCKELDSISLLIQEFDFKLDEYNIESIEIGEIEFDLQILNEFEDQNEAEIVECADYVRAIEARQTDQEVTKSSDGLSALLQSGITIFDLPQIQGASFIGKAKELAHEDLKVNMALQSLLDEVSIYLNRVAVCLRYLDQEDHYQMDENSGWDNSEEAEGPCWPAERDRDVSNRPLYLDNFLQNAHLFEASLGLKIPNITDHRLLLDSVCSTALHSTSCLPNWIDELGAERAKQVAADFLRLATSLADEIRSLSDYVRQSREQLSLIGLHFEEKGLEVDVDYAPFLECHLKHTDPLPSLTTRKQVQPKNFSNLPRYKVITGHCELEKWTP
ncbi:MAG: hypothetical protein AAGI72_05535 [Pseudomonadota bacterium]